MDLIEQVKGYSDSREEEELEDEEALAAATVAEEIIKIPREEEEEESSNSRLQKLIELSLGGGGCGSTNTTPHDATCSSSISSTNNNNNNDGRRSSSNNNVEKEHMFDKVVTPSDVGKLNRLVIPKQHAEKYFPLDSSSNQKGLLLNFEDRNGKLWKFRYSYWNSSQSYVMTKGWSRFVKEKKLHSGDIVSFKRGVGDLYRHMLYIDWRRRLEYHSHNHNHNHNHNLLHLPNQYSITWGGRLYSLPSPNASTSTMLIPPNHNLNYNNSPLYNNNFYHHHQQQQQQQLQYYDGYMRSTPSMSMHQIVGDQNLQERGNNTIAPMIIDSVPVTHHHHQQQQQDSHLHGGIGIGNSTSNAGKILRLFGVNMECASSPAEDSKCLFSSSASAPLHVTIANSLSSSSLRVPYEDHHSLSPSTRGTTTSVFFDLDPSLQYRQ